MLQGQWPGANWLLLGAGTFERCACDLMSLLVSQVLPGEPFVSRQWVSPVITVTRPVRIETDAMEKKNELEGGQFLWLQSHLDLSDQGTDFPWVPTSSTQTSCRFGSVFCCRSSSSLTVHTCTGLCGTLLCRADWLSLRGIAGSECAILPILEVVDYLSCSIGGQSSPGGRPAARRALPSREHSSRTR